MRKIEASFCKLGRAEEHINNLAHILCAHEGIGDGYFFVASSCGRELILRHVSSVPTISLLIGEAIYQMRSSLDLAVVDLSLCNSPNCDISKVEFPTDKIKSRREAKTKYLAPKHRQYLEDHAKAFDGGDPLLCWLNSARNVDVHVQLISGEIKPEVSNLIRIVNKNIFDFRELVAGELTGIMAATAIDRGTSITADGFAIDVSSIGLPIVDLVEIANQHVQIPLRFCFSHANKQKKAIIGSDPVLPKLCALHRRVGEVLHGLATV